MKLGIIPEGGSGSVQFSPKFQRYLSRMRADRAITAATDDDVATLLPDIRSVMTVADDEVIAAVRGHAPHAFTVARAADGRPSALLALLPLNADGAGLLVAGRLNPRRVAVAHLAAPGEPPVAVYIWLLWAPSRLIDGLRLVDVMVRGYAGLDAPLFSRPVNDDAQRLHLEMGFTPAGTVYPGAPWDLMAILPVIPDRREARSRPSAVDCRIARSMEDVLQAFAIRSATYMVEQDCPYGEEFDGNDFSATHLIANVDGEPAACARIRWFGDFAKIERMAVRPQFRRTRAAFRLARFAIDHCRRKGFQRIYAHSRADLLPLWKVFGLTPMPEREVFEFSNVSFREVFGELAPDPNAIRFGADPMVANRPEGAWDQPGPLERAASVRERKPAAKRPEEPSRRFDASTARRSRCG